MFRLPSMSMFVVLVAIAGQRVVAQSPLVYSHYVPRPTVDMRVRAAYADIPGSEQTLTVPAGTAFITWSVHGAVQCLSGCTQDTARFRPVIGASFPAEGMPDDNDGTSSGSWTAPTEAGNITVKLQVAAPAVLDEDEWRFVMASSETFSQDAMSWTLMVFPDAVAGVPAIGGLGLVVLVAVLLGVGAILIASRPRASPT